MREIDFDIRIETSSDKLNTFGSLTYSMAIIADMLCT